MSSLTPPTPIRDNDYEAIETALLDTTQGRWFLAEYMRRNQPAAYTTLRDALKKLENALNAPPEPAPSGEVMRRDLIEMSEAISRTRREIASMKPDADEDSQLVNATGELDAIVASTEKATSDILSSAEDIQEVAWLLRENGMDEETCDRLDNRATEIYMSCSFQDLTGQRIDKVVNVLRFLESRVVAMIKIWGLEVVESDLEFPGDERPDAHLLNGPQMEGQGLEQSGVDLVIQAKAMERDVDDFATIETADEAPIPAAAAHPEPLSQTPAEPQLAEVSAAFDQANNVPSQSVAQNPVDGGAALSVETLDGDQNNALFN